MKMLTIVCREMFEDEVLLLLQEQKISGYTVLNEVGGSGVRDSWLKDHNKVFWMVLDEERIPSMVDAVKALHASLIQDHGHIKIPFKAFLQSCEAIA